MIITVDCGTTNMRCRLFDGENWIDEVKQKTGSRDAVAAGSTVCLENALKTCIETLQKANGISEDDVEVIVASGILASDIGICRIPHVAAPAGVLESGKAAKTVVFPRISRIPVFLIPGVKTLPGEDAGEEEKIEAWESMSGEECEVYGIVKQLGLTGDFVVTLPGSYNKIMDVDGTGRIVSIRTGMCGEFIEAISRHTILSHSLPDPVIQQLIPERLVQGYDYCSRHGVSPTLIKARMVQLLGNWSEQEAANFFVGAILYDDVRMIREVCRSDRRVLVGGSNPLRRIFGILLRHIGVVQVIEIDDECARLAPGIGAIEVYKASI